MTDLRRFTADDIRKSNQGCENNSNDHVGTEEALRKRTAIPQDGKDVWLETVMGPADCTMFFETIRGGIGHSTVAKEKLKQFVVGYIGEVKPTHDPGHRGKAAPLELKAKIQQILLVVFFIGIHVAVVYYNLYM